MSWENPTNESEPVSTSTTTPSNNVKIVDIDIPWGTIISLSFKITIGLIPLVLVGGCISGVLML